MAKLPGQKLTLNELLNAENKLAEVKTQFDLDKTKLDELTKRRGEIRAKEILSGETDKKQLVELDDGIAKLQAGLNGVPDVIAALEVQIDKLKEQQSQEVREANLAQQKEIAKQIEVASGELVEALRLAVEQHNKLQALFEVFWALRKKAEGYGEPISDCICTGAYTRGLAEIYEVCKLEIEGKASPKPPVPVSAPTPQAPLAEVLSRKS